MTVFSERASMVWRYRIDDDSPWVYAETLRDVRADTAGRKVQVQKRLSTVAEYRAAGQHRWQDRR